MKISLITILEAIILTSALSMDAFVASFAYGSNKIKIPMLSVQIINTICSTMLGISLIIGTLIKQYIPDWLTAIVCFIILFVLKCYKMPKWALTSMWYA